MNQARQRKTPTPSRLNAATRPSCNFTLFYIDDSGSEAAGCTTFSWIEISPATWTDAADRWNNYRTALYERYGIPTADRLHATDLATGRGYRTRGTAGKSADHGRQILRHGIETIASLPGAAVGSVYRRTTARGRAFERVKQDLYQRLLDALDTRLLATDTYGSVIMDGDGSNTGYATSHHQRNITTSRLIEDPFFRHASTSQWVQAADLVAWTAYRSLRPGAHRAEHDSWYDGVLRPLDIHGGPVRL
ncbi:DUF3800 domain-containing protein [Catenuloplanes japonicus]|uniref:DUF3800 domain-containing protein n=1 Tax=Catenuloplanes japonicus TaxID=33876 RepID=UPI0005275234|nr:DUF3800 domain-containing protein [Catenuloplanes japonicus]